MAHCEIYFLRIPSGHLMVPNPEALFAVAEVLPLVSNHSILGYDGQNIPAI